jgi:hypothetical protein
LPDGSKAVGKAEAKSGSNSGCRGGAAMAIAAGRTRGVITFAEILKDKGYPGFDPVKQINAPWVSDQLSLFKPEDEARFWFKGFQWPRAYPLNFVWLEDGFAWGTQAAAHNMPLPPSDGLAPRIAGIFVYGSDIPVTPWVAGCRAERVGAVLPPFLQYFPAIWDERRDEIVKGLRYLETDDLSGKSPAEIWQFMADARAFHVRAWEIHFDLMYPLTANYLGFYGLCKELGIAAPDIPKFLQGYETQPMKSDRAMWQLANSVRGSQVHKLIADTAPGSTRLSRARPPRRLGSRSSMPSCRNMAGAATGWSMSARPPGLRIRIGASASSARCCKATTPTRSRTV